MPFLESSAERSPAEGAIPAARDRFLPVSAWALYDFANTIFYAVVVTRYLPLHVLEITGKHSSLEWGFFPAMAAAAFLAPWLGGFAGRRGVSKKSVLVLTLLCVLSTALLAAARSAFVLIGLFGLAQVFYQLALVPYNNLLPAVSSPGKMGRVSGLGVGLGYGGVILSLWAADWVMKIRPGYGTAYLVAAFLFFLFTLPFLFFVPEKKPEKGASAALPGIRDFIGLLEDPLRRRFIAGNFLCADALNAILIFMAVYLSRGLGFDDSAILKTLIWLNVTALCGGIGCGFLTDSFTPRRIMILAALALGAAVAAAQFSGSQNVRFLAVVLLGGPGVAGLWVAGRKWVVQLSPEGDTGPLFGLYGLTNKVSLVNVILFAFLADRTGSYLWSVLVLLASLAGGIILLYKAVEHPGRRPGRA